MKKNKIDLIKKRDTYKKLVQVEKARIRLALKISSARSKKDLSQEHLAKLAGTTQRIISQIENGEFNVGFDLLGRILDALGLRQVIIDSTDSTAMIPGQKTYIRENTINPLSRMLFCPTEYGAFFYMFMPWPKNTEGLKNILPNAKNTNIISIPVVNKVETLEPNNE